MKKTLQGDYPKIPPYKSSGVHFQAKTFSNTIIKKYNWDEIRNSPEIDLLEALKGLTHVECDLEMKRDFKLKKRQELNSQWLKLEEKEASLKTEFLRFDTFVRENHEKRQRAIELFQDTKKIVEERCAKLTSLQNKFEEMIAIKTSLDQKVKDYKIYEQFLEKVVQIAPEFKNTNDLINRYECLQNAKKELAKRQEATLTNLETARSSMLKLMEENNLKILGLNTELSSLNSRYRKAASNSIHWEGVVSDILDGCYDFLSQFIDVKRAIWVVYLTMCGRENAQPQLEKDDYEGHLIYIKHNLEVLENMKHKANNLGKNR